MLDFQLINRLRNLVNSNSYYMLHKYRDQDGKNRWNIICSAMDWISIAVNNYNKFSFKFKREDMDAYCMEVYSFISMIDIIFEAVNQLHRVLISPSSIPFSNEKIHFSNNNNIDDNNYFKHIRAIFGAHPVNLYNNKERWYASWPTKDHFGKYDIQAFLYPLDSNKETITFGIHFNELRSFVTSRYNYLNVLIDEINSDYERYIKKCQSEKIEYNGDYLQDILFVKNALMERLPNDYIASMVDNSIRFISTESTLKVNEKVVERFINKVKNAVNDLKLAVQEMDYEKHKSYEIFDYQFPNEQFYEFSKYSEVLLGRYDPLEPYLFVVVSDTLKPYVLINEDMHIDEIYLLFHVGLFLLGLDDSDD